MKPFHTIALPHQDILQGRLTMDVFAADLWEVFNQRGRDEYKDPDTFFRKTYLTQGLQNLLTVVENRLSGKGGDPVIQIQTPFGGGKTHSLIALYHKSSQWGAKKAVIVGTTLPAKTTLWEILEKQLSGKIEKLKGMTSPGKEALRTLIHKKQPVLILMDEVLEYVVKAGGIRVGDSTLAAQTIAFIQELTETIGTVENACIVITLPSSIVEHYDANAETLFQQLQKVTGRVEKIFTPVDDREITSIIRKRLFSQIDEKQAKNVVAEFMDYAEKESIIPSGMDPSAYRDAFLASYPFMPEVVDILYHRWGSFPSFQRTRGVLRLLSLMIHSHKETQKSYLGLSDFDLSDQNIRQDLIKHIGAEFNSIIAADISGKEAGSKAVDQSLGKTYQGLNLGTRIATMIFMMSFSGGVEHGASLGEVKRSATTLANPSSAVVEALEQMKGKLFYIQCAGDKYFFSNQPNLNRILINKMENVKSPEETALEKHLIERNISGQKLKVYIWKEDSSDISNNTEMKLVILSGFDENIMKNILNTKGQTPRVLKNTIFFLYPVESERMGFSNILRKKIAYEMIEQDMGLRLSDEQKKTVKKEIKSIESDLDEALGRLYRMVAIPEKGGLKYTDLGIPTYGEDKKIDEAVYDKLRSESEILERISPLVIKEKYLADKEYVFTEQLYQSTLTTPGETRVISPGVFERSITEGIRQKLFGLGEWKENMPQCVYFGESPLTVAFMGHEILIREDTCHKQIASRLKIPGEGIPQPKEPSKLPESPGTSIPVSGEMKQLELRFKIPKGKISQIMGTLNYIQSKFNTLEISLKATDGSITEQEYEDKITESFRQLDMDI